VEIILIELTIHSCPTQRGEEEHLAVATAKQNSLPVAKLDVTRYADKLKRRRLVLRAGFIDEVVTLAVRDADQNEVLRGEDLAFILHRIQL
jgi:hypothetical protein